MSTHFAKNDLEASWSEIAKKVGVSSARIGQIEQEAFMKIRALIFGTDDFPLLREAFGKLGSAALERDLANGEKYRERVDAKNARDKAKRQAMKGGAHARG